MACTIIAVNFVDQNDNLFSPSCEVAPSTNVRVKVKLSFDIATNAYIYYTIDTPNGRQNYYGNGGNRVTFIAAGTYYQYLTISDGFNTTTSGNYTIQGIYVLSQDKTATICGVVNPLNDCITLTVTGGGTVPLGDISIQPAISVNIGATTTLSASCKNTNGVPISCPSLNWVSNNTSIVTVSNGIIKGIASGTTTIAAVDPVTLIVSNPCQVTVPSASITYQCINNICQKSSCTVGATGCYQSSNCNNVCTGSGGTLQCINCDPTKNYCISGNCIPKSYVIWGTIGFFALMMLRQ